ncbi:MAG: type II toxin-antitoxin system HicB family antitoxin [Drouetiella hepatica Uher 2000/2452]|uniref:Type II toxin-antitoxin system HicB family antitoxin n=1 Tax=Drouetiella hepatica Uher 2000/2452 TaxID=904376 RepID=A0A951QF47_9CYAN|nr:type II toxin-antitoxin system HicB family antitoxin [Drouetiella hepatica Uher 2000/2452]
MTTYIQAAMHQATYELLEDRTFYGEILPCPGVMTNAQTLEDCRELLQDALEGWILLGLKLGHEMPTIDGISLGIQQEEAA